MAKFLRTISILTTMSTKPETVNSGFIEHKLKEALANYPTEILADFNAITTEDELNQIKQALDHIKSNLKLEVSPEVFLAIDRGIDDRKQAITTIRQLGRNCQELLETEHELSRRAGILADLLTKYKAPLTTIANNANFIPQAIAAYRTLQETDSEFPSLDKVDLQSLDGISKFVHELRYNVGRSENFGKRIAAIFDITLSYSKIEYVIRTFLEDKKNLPSINRDDFQKLDNWPIAPMQRLPRLMLFPNELKKLLGKLSANPTVTGQQISDINERIEYFFKEKIYKHSHRLNQAKKAMDERLKLKRINSTYLANLAALFTGQVIQWETDEAPEIKAVIDSVPNLMLASTLGTAPSHIGHTSAAQPSASPAAPSIKSDEQTIPSENLDFDKYLEQLDQFGEPLVNHPQSPTTSPLIRTSSTILQNNELDIDSFKKMISAVQKRQQEPSAETMAVAQSAIEQKSLEAQAAEARQKTEADERARKEREAKAEQERLAREEKRRQDALDKKQAEEAKQKAEAEQRQLRAKEEAECRHLEEQARQERERQAAEEQRKAAEERANKERGEAERSAAERRAQIEREHQKQLEQARRAQAESEQRNRKAREEAVQRATLARAQQEREAAAQREQAERERLAREEQELRSKSEAEARAKQAREEAERLEKEHQAREEQLAAEKEAKRLANVQQKQARQEAVARAGQIAVPQQQPSITSTKIPVADIEAAKQLVDDYCGRLRKPFADFTKAPEDIFTKDQQAASLSRHLDDLLKNASEQDKAILNGAIFTLIKTLLTEDPSLDPFLQQQNKLNAIAQFERDYCHLTYTGGEKVLATLKTIVVIAVGLVLGAAIAATAAVIIAAAATGVVPPLTVAGVTASLTTAWSIYAGSGGAILGTIIGTTAGIKRFFFPENLPKDIAVGARSYLAAAHSPKLSA